MTIINTNTVEDFIVDTLSAVTALASVKVQPWPDDTRDYLTKFTAPKGALLVQYRGSEYNPDPPEPNNKSKLFQMRDMRWVVAILMRNAYSHDASSSFTGGIYGLLDEVKKALTGKTVTKLVGAVVTPLDDVTIMYPRSDYFVDRVNQNIYIHEIEFGVSGPETE